MPRNTPVRINIFDLVHFFTFMCVRFTGLPTEQVRRLGQLATQIHFEIHLSRLGLCFALCLWLARGLNKVKLHRLHLLFQQFMMMTQSADALRQPYLIVSKGQCLLSGVYQSRLLVLKRTSCTSRSPADGSWLHRVPQHTYEHQRSMQPAMMETSEATLQFSYSSKCL